MLLNKKSMVKKAKIKLSRNQPEGGKEFLLNIHLQSPNDPISMIEVFNTEKSLIEDKMVEDEKEKKEKEKLDELSMFGPQPGFFSIDGFPQPGGGNFIGF